MKGVLSDMIQNSSLIIQNWRDPRKKFCLDSITWFWWSYFGDSITQKTEWWREKVKTHFPCFQNSSSMTQWQFRNITEIVAPLWDPRQGHVYIKSSTPTTFSFSLSPCSFSQQQTNISSKTQQLWRMKPSNQRLPSTGFAKFSVSPWQDQNFLKVKKLKKLPMTSPATSPLLPKFYFTKP